MSEIQENEYVAAPERMPLVQYDHAPLGDTEPAQRFSATRREQVPLSDMLASAANAVTGAAAAFIRAATREIPTAKFGDMVGYQATPHAVCVQVDEMLRGLRTTAHTNVEDVKAKAISAIAALPASCALNGAAAAQVIRLATTSDRRAVLASVKSFGDAVKDEHRTGYSAGMVSCIERAMYAVGMRPAETTTRGTDVEVRAMDTQGRGLRTALLFDEHGRLSMRTKLVGFQDGACHEVMERYYADLREQGITFSGGSRHWRHGTCLINPEEQQQQQPMIRRNTQRQ